MSGNRQLARPPSARCSILNTRSLISINVLITFYLFRINITRTVVPDTLFCGMSPYSTLKVNRRFGAITYIICADVSELSLP
jgi:hypothetical protein